MELSSGQCRLHHLHRGCGEDPPGGMVQHSFQSSLQNFLKVLKRHCDCGQQRRRQEFRGKKKHCQRNLPLTHKGWYQTLIRFWETALCQEGWERPCRVSYSGLFWDLLRLASKQRAPSRLLCCLHHGGETLMMPRTLLAHEGNQETHTEHRPELGKMWMRWQQCLLCVE